jgi:hypothetical protein
MAETTHYDSTLESWSKFQQQWWGQWLSTTQQTSNILRELCFSKPVGLFETLIDCGLSAQSELIRSYAKDLEGAAGDSMPMNEWMEQHMASAKMWTEAQRQAWDTWISAIRALESVYATGKAEDNSDNVIHGFQDMTQKTLEMQTEWFSHWLPESEDAELETAPEEAIMQRGEDLEQAKSAA